MNTVDEYINSFDVRTREILHEIRKIIKETAPKAVESISYGMPAYKYNGTPLVYFAAFKNHIGFYATPQGHEKFSTELVNYKQGKGSVQFPIDKPMPLELIKRITHFKMEVCS
ncbi:DUF1801 domain-containing protein [Flavobacterium sp. SUN052]|uniref:iron chaperone n=1 Tax=Flavobacterium sp. SUN052 TaxID=3002441 RepID=UPI00237D722F|nr:DUF1801 domain-containing protein [Flavobacterium sp. SUN052]MEC4004963.1 DUF1801 domain-containing protein [Flavobacterium sp. SUN052]